MNSEFNLKNFIDRNKMSAESTKQLVKRNLIHFDGFKLDPPIVTPKVETLANGKHCCLYPPKAPSPGKFYRSDVERLLEKIIENEISASIIGDDNKDMNTDRGLMYTERDGGRHS